jgi:hypothetical protein
MHSLYSACSFLSGPGWRIAHGGAVVAPRANEGPLVAAAAASCTDQLRRERLKSHLLDVCVRAPVVPPNIGTNRPICIDHLRAYFVVVVWDLYSICTLLSKLTESVREID